MKLRCALLLALVCSLATLGHMAAQPRDLPPMSPAELARELARVRGEVAELAAKPQLAPALAAELPKSWRVRSARGEMEVSADSIRAALERFLKAPPNQKGAQRKELEDSLRLLEAEAEAYDAAAPVPPELHRRLEQILQAREFRGLRGLSPIQLLWQRITSWLQQQLEKLFPKMPSATEAGPVFAWCVIALLCIAMAVWFYRRSRETELKLLLDAIPLAPGAKGWRSWLAEARACAGRGEWRDAIHLAFWAGVAKLEAEGTWHPDRARTPREYLRAIPEWNTARPAFQSVMGSFERSWYGGLPAGADDFRQVEAALERMGCR